jgi:hypothetical protein
MINITAVASLFVLISAMGASEDSDIRSIDGVPKLLWGGFGTYTDDLMVSSTLRLCLDYIGEKYSKTYIAGTSGAAFDTGWGRGMVDAGAGGAIFAHPGHFEDGVDNLFKAIGREYNIAYKSDPEKLWDVAVHSIDAGHPVIASEWAVDHFAVIAGYNPEKREFVGRRYSGRDESPDEYVPIKPDVLAFVMSIGDKSEKTPRREAVLNSLRFAISSAQIGRDTDVKGQGGTSHGMVYGPLAYEEHAGMIPEKLDPEHERYGWREHVLLWRLNALSLARAYAVLYLQEAMDVFSPSEEKHIRKAIEKYCELLGMLISDNISDSRPMKLGSYEIPIADPRVEIIFGPISKEKKTALFWCEGEKVIPIWEFFGNIEGRRRFADWLLRIKGVEEEAISELEKALNG